MGSSSVLRSGISCSGSLDAGVASHDQLQILANSTPRLENRWVDTVWLSGGRTPDLPSAEEGREDLQRTEGEVLCRRRSLRSLRNSGLLRNEEVTDVDGSPVEKRNE